MLGAAGGWAGAGAARSPAAVPHGEGLPSQPPGRQPCQHRRRRGGGVVAAGVERSILAVSCRGAEEQARRQGAGSDPAAARAALLPWLSAGAPPAWAPRWVEAWAPACRGCRRPRQPRHHAAAARDG